MATTTAGRRNVKQDRSDDAKTVVTDHLEALARDAVAANGMVASAHPEASRIGVEILEAGGNAFDAALAALCTAAIAEPLLASLGGGGFLLALPGGKKPSVYDFFCQTPGRRRPVEETDFYPILANFGAAEQEFHIGLGSSAVPGVVAGSASGGSRSAPRNCPPPMCS